MCVCVYMYMKAKKANIEVSPKVPNQDATGAFIILSTQFTKSKNPQTHEYFGRVFLLFLKKEKYFPVRNA